MVLKLLAANHTSTATTTLYTVPGTSLGAIVNNVRLVNTNTSTNSATVNVYLTSGGTDYLISEKDKVIAIKELFLIKPEVTLAPNDAIKVVASGTSLNLDYVISGTEQY